MPLLHCLLIYYTCDVNICVEMDPGTHMVCARFYPLEPGVNQFADLTTEEFKANKGFKPISAEEVPTTGFKYENLSVSALPTAVDWRTKGAVTPIKNQGQCGMCIHILWSYLKAILLIMT
jgi:hypothetical protein